MEKKYETILVFILIGIIMIFGFKYINSMFEKSTITSLQVRTKTLMDTVEKIGVESVIKDEDIFPLSAVFTNKEMYLKKGSPAKVSIYEGKFNFSYALPDDGEIIVLKNEKVIVNNIKFGKYICNTLKQGEVICKKA